MGGRDMKAGMANTAWTSRSRRARDRSVLAGGACLRLHSQVADKRETTLKPAVYCVEASYVVR